MRPTSISAIKSGLWGYDAM